MYLPNLASCANKTVFDSRVFIYEILIRPPVGASQGFNASLYRQSKVYLQVPYSRMNQVMRRIARSGGKILSIRPLSKDLAQPGMRPQLPWWVEISTSQPRCLYYFGPFDSAEEAISSQAGYLEDLEGEGAQSIKVHIIQGRPAILTQEW